VPKLLVDETLQIEREEPSSEMPWLVCGLFRPDENAEEVTALEIAVMEAGSFSGGECFHRSRGFIFSSAGVPALLGMSMAFG
jgi:hypothetical protein